MKPKFVKIAARVVAFFLALLFLLGAFLYVFADEEKEAVPLPTPLSKNVLLYNLQYGKVLYEKDSKEKIFPASFAKIMTVILAYEHLADLGTSPTVTAENVSSLPNGISMEEGEIFRFEDLLAALVVGSSNNTAALLARAISGTEEDFVRRMNERAKELGCVATNFTNPTGLHDDNAYTTLSDVAKICAAAYKINDYMTLSSTTYLELPPTNLRDKPYRVYGSNLLHYNRTDRGYGYYVEGAMGINSGMTFESGYCTASVRETAGAINLVLVSGGYKETSEEAEYISSYLDAKELFEYAERAFHITTILKKESIIKEIPVTLSDTHDHVLLVTNSDISSILPVDFNPETDIEQRVYLTSETLEAPVMKDTSLGTLELYYEGTLIGSTELVTQRGLSRSTSLALANSVQNFLRLPAVRITLIVLAIVIVSFLLICIILLIIQKQKKNGLSFAEWREKRRRERELIWKEKVRQRDYFRESRKVRRARRAEAIRDFREARERYLKEQAEAERRARERERKNATRPQGTRPAQGRVQSQGQRPQGQGGQRPQAKRRDLPPQERRPAPPKK